MTKATPRDNIKAFRAAMDYIANPPVACRWFLRCENTAVTERSHPVLGQVPICKRCNDKLNAIEEKAR